MSVDTLLSHTYVQQATALDADIRPAFASIAKAYQTKWGLTCLLIDTDGRVIDGIIPCAEYCQNDHCCSARQKALDEALRWGEPSLYICPGGYVIWAVPVMKNAQVLGGIVVGKVDIGSSGSETTALGPVDIRKAAADLLALATEMNITNAALLELRRVAAQRESERAEAIHVLKDQNYQTIRDIYLVEEPSLISAIKSGDRTVARGILNRVLVGIYFMGRERPTLLKSFLLELVVTMSRSAVEAGGDPAELLGANYSNFADLARIDSEEELCAWLVSTLERIMDAIKSNDHYPISVLIGSALKYMQEHLHEDLSRDDVAKIACLSPSHFSRVMKQTYGYSFTELLARMRTDKAREMLILTEKSLVQICLECGFSDQSYFTKVFQKYTGQTPGGYRRLHRSAL
ncbi:MAG TPA: helix-turn-helix domain-containing protein [Armatimonadota bacterium]|nr:helix-turn-helix domain-containing protein [Armatimonadota bacterium]